MKRICPLLFIVIAGLSAHSQARLPRFADHPAKLEKVRIKKLDFRRDPDAASFRTRLNSAFKGGVNFAGRYIIAGWGCGAGCVNGAIIDTRSGRIFAPDEFSNLDATYGDGYAEKLLDYRKDSKLLIIHGRPGSRSGNGSPEPSGDHYYVWNGSRFKKIKTVEKH